MLVVLMVLGTGPAGRQMLQLLLLFLFLTSGFFLKFWWLDNACNGGANPRPPALQPRRACPHYSQFTGHCAPPARRLPPQSQTRVIPAADAAAAAGGWKIPSSDPPLCCCRLGRPPPIRSALGERTVEPGEAALSERAGSLLFLLLRLLLLLGPKPAVTWPPLEWSPDSPLQFLPVESPSFLSCLAWPRGVASSTARERGVGRGSQATSQ